MPRRVRYVAKAEYFENWKVAWFFKANGHIPIRRGEGSDWKRAMEAAAEALDAGELFGIYPEGTRSKDGKLHRGHTGVAMLAAADGRPGHPHRLRRHRQGPAGRLEDDLAVQAVDHPDRPADRLQALADQPKGQRVLRAMTDTVMTEIQSLSGQEYTGRYAALGDRRPSASQSGYARSRTPWARSTARRQASWRRSASFWPIAGVNSASRQPVAGHLVGARPHAFGQAGQVGGAERRGLGQLRPADRHAELVGLELEQQVHHRRPAVGPQLGDGGAADAAVMASTTSRVW